MKEEERRITRKGMLAAVAGGVGAVALLALGRAKEARAQGGIEFVKITDTNGIPINPSTEDTLALIKTKTDNLDALFSSSVGRRLRNVGDTAYIDPRDRNWTITETVPVSGSLGRTWTITETVPISHANLDAALSTLATQATLALIKAKTDNLDAALSTLATQATLALIRAKTDNLDVLLSTIASQATLALIKTQTDNLDVLLSTRLKLADYVITQELGRVGLILAAGGAIIDPRDRNWTITETVPVSGSLGRSWTLGASDIPDISDRAARLLGVVYGSRGQQLIQTATNFNLQSELATGATLYDARQIRTLTSTDVVDISDKAARLLGIVYGSRGQQLVQTATNFNLQTELATGGTLYDGRQIRTLTTTDKVESRVGNSINTLLFKEIDVAASGDNTIVAADASNKIKVTDYSIVCDAAVAARWKSGAGTNLSGAMSFAANGGIMAAAGAGRWLLETAVNQALVLNLGAAVGARGHATYFKEAS